MAYDDGIEIDEFTETGRHTRTLDALSLAPRYTFTYDPSGRLTAITDGKPISVDLNQQFEELGGFPDAVLFANLETIECGIALSEHQRSLFAVRVTGHDDSKIAHLRARLATQ